MNPNDKVVQVAQDINRLVVTCLVNFYTLSWLRIRVSNFSFMLAAKGIDINQYRQIKTLWNWQTDRKEWIQELNSTFQLSFLTGAFSNRWSSKICDVDLNLCPLNWLLLIYKEHIE